MRSRNILGRLISTAAISASTRNNLILRSSREWLPIGKTGNNRETMLAGGAGVAALAAMNASIRRNASEPDDSALGGEAQLFNWKYGRIFYKSAGVGHAGTPLVFIHGVGAGSSSFMWRKNFDALAR